jgi:malto-oligosyltrehalose trehalohydrolase
MVRLHERDEMGRPLFFTAEWNDDFHHAAHVLSTKELDGYYQDYTDPVGKIGRAVAEGFVYQGESSAFWNGVSRGEPSGHLPPTAFIDFLQNHDQIGNRAFGERLASLASEETLKLLTAILLMSPHIPLLFMGEEWGERRPFCFFTDFAGELGKLVREGRRNEFRKWPAFENPESRARIPDPNAESTFAAAVLDWEVPKHAGNARHLEYVRELLRLRHTEIVPRLARLSGGQAHHCGLGSDAVQVTWRLSGTEELTLLANFGDASVVLPETWRGTQIRVLNESAVGVADHVRGGKLPARSVLHCFHGG